MVFKMHDSVLSARYSHVCNLLRLRRIWPILLLESTDSMVIQTKINIEQVLKNLTACGHNIGV